ncbi:microtubule organization protein AKNA-like [Gigantopelta aegis]|uniref:microtubule organization protein AKNA-like n=1 Tax=Gigantopelta aegis TaxID=1735272 RepID=UPI001B88DF25|nr:microtubule organization protein AKNA-like [Gigantopelta aegis]
MAFLAVSDDFDLDDHGILRDSASSTGGFLIDDDGIIRDDLGIYKHTGSHWSDSGFDGGKLSSSSTLRRLQTSFDDDDDSRLLDQSVNISEFEASKDDLSFERPSVSESYERPSVSESYDFQNRGDTPRDLLDPGSSFDRSIDFARDKGLTVRADTPKHLLDSVSLIERSGDFNDADIPEKKPRGREGDQKELFSEEYYNQLRDLGVLIDDGDLSDARNSIEGFEREEAYCSREDLNFRDHPDPLDNISDFLQKDHNENPNTISEFFRYESVKTQDSSVVEPGELFQQNEYTGRPISPGSQTTVSNKSFPEVSPEEALLLYQRNRNAQFIDRAAETAFGDQQREIDTEGLFHKSGDDPGIFQRTGDEDEIFLITGGLIPSSTINTSSSVHQCVTPYSNQSSRRSSQGSVHSYQFETYNRDGQVVVQEVNKTASPQNMGKERQHTTEPAAHSRPSSSASFLSTNSDNQSRPSTARSGSSKKLSKAKSEESFFEHSKTSTSVEKGPKRLLPTPVDDSQSYKLKSKSTTNISGQSGPVKPTHMSISQITRMTMDEGADMAGGGDGDKPPGEMTMRLKQEFQKRKQATELVQQLQKDYDSLLSKYALAELTIDQMRLGAKITLHADSPTPGQIHTGTMSPAQHPQVIQISGTNRGVFSSSSPSQGRATSTYSSPVPESIDMHDNPLPSNSHLLSNSQLVNRMDRGNHVETSSVNQREEKVVTPKNVGAEGVKSSLLHQAGNIAERVETFGSILETRQLSLEDQEQVFEQLRTDHEKLRRCYLQAKEDYNVLRRSGASLTDANFDQNKQLEGELFRLGMRFDEIHEKVDKNLKEKSAKRQPFQANRLVNDQSDMSHDEDESAIDQSKQMMHRTLAGSDLIQPMEDSEFEQKIQMLHEQYNALMDRYRRLKQMAPTPEKDKEIDNLVKKLKEICNEAPDIFRLPPELDERWDRMQKREVGSRGKSPVPDTQASDSASRPNTQGQTNKDERLSDREKQKSGHVENSRRALNTSSSSRGSLVSPRDRLSSPNKISPLPSRYSPLPSNRISPRDRAPGGRNSPHSDRDSLRSGRESRHGRESPSDSESYSSNVPRPRRRDHQFQDHKMKKRPDGGSMTSLREGSTSDNDSRTLANLPGPGKLKQMTRQRGADDVDSGFIGSVVGSDVSQHQPPQQQQQQQRQPQQQPLRVRHQATERNETGSSARDSGGPAAKTRVSSNIDRPSSRGGSVQERDKRDASTEADSMDVSFYDDVTDSDLSELDVRTPKKMEKILGARRVGSKDSSRTLEDSGQDSDVTPRPVERLRLSSDKKTPTQTPLKPNHRSRVRSSEEDEEEGELTPRASASRDIPQQCQRFSSEDGDLDTPRSAKTRKPSRTITSSRVGENRESLPPELQQAHGRNEVRSEVRSQLRVENVRRLENRGTGSDLRWDAKGTDSDATRTSSVASSRLRALQKEVEKLKEKMFQVRETPPPPPPPEPPLQPQQPEYYDPFDDPYGFMRMPRRRANSFSGSPVREWDEWYWTLPLQRQNEGHDIPLGYAAADVYAEIPPPAAPTPGAQPAAQPHSRSRVRRRRVTRETPQGPVIATVEQNGYASDPPQTRTNPQVSGKTATAAAAATTATVSDQENVGLYDYYVPRSRYSTQGMRQQLTNRGLLPDTFWSEDLRTPAVWHITADVIPDSVCAESSHRESHVPDDDGSGSRASGS